MQRKLENLARSQFDMLVIGGGIHGICVARDAAQRGLSVAMLERGDFGGETSHNSLKLVHGGLRYIQHLDFRRMRQSIAERRAWLRIAPHLVRPLKCVMQTFGHFTRGPEALWSAITLYELLGLDRNQGVSTGRRVPRGGIVGRNASDQLIPGMPDGQHNGAAFWYDGQMLDADRIMIECVESAVDSGAEVANYVEVQGLLFDGTRVTGASVVDAISGNTFDVRAKMVINAAGPWVDSMQLLTNSGRREFIDAVPQTINMNFVVRKAIADHAIAVKSKRRSDSRIDQGDRLFFITPWRGISVVGTTHVPYDGDAGNANISREDLETFVQEVIEAYPNAEINIDDVVYCYFGLTPGVDSDSNSAAFRARHSHVVDHRREHGVEGLLSVIGVKWTTARLVAELSVDLGIRELEREAHPCKTAVEPLPGAVGFESIEALVDDMESTLGATDSGTAVNDLAHEYGTRWRSVACSESRGEPDFTDGLERRKVEYAVRHEMAVRLADVLCRRTSLLQRGRLTRAHVDWCCNFMAKELNWSDDRQAAEMSGFNRHVDRHYGTVLGQESH